MASPTVLVRGLLSVLAASASTCGRSGSCAWASPADHAASRPNIFMAVFDDLRPSLEPYASKSAVTPNMQRLAAAPGTVVFDNAYVQQAVCGPR